MISENCAHLGRWLVRKGHLERTVICDVCGHVIFRRSWTQAQVDEHAKVKAVKR